jgi:hypothetical protein
VLQIELGLEGLLLHPVRLRRTRRSVDFPRGRGQPDLSASICPGASNETRGELGPDEVPIQDFLFYRIGGEFTRQIGGLDSVLLAYFHQIRESVLVDFEAL